MECKEIQVTAARMKPLIIGSSIFPSSLDFQISEYELHKARKELGETEEKKADGLKELKEKLGSNENISYRIDDDYLLRFLRHTKFDCEKAYKIICKFVSTRTKWPEIYTLPSNLESLLNLNLFSYLPYTDEDGNSIFWIDIRKWNLEETSFVEFMQMSLAVCDIILMNPKCQIIGTVCIYDMRGLSASHIACFMKPRTLWLLLNLLQDFYPHRFTVAFFIHCNSLVRAAYYAVRPLMKKKIVERLVLLGSDITELQQRINPAILPRDYGGNLDEKEYTVTQDVLRNLPYLKYERTFGAVSA